MPAIDLLQQWQDAEAACASAYRAIYAKVQRGVYVGADELERLTRMSHQATVRYEAYLEQVTARESPEPNWKRAADAERAALPGPKHRPSMV